MNKNNLRTYAPQARRDFMRAVSDRAALLGLSTDVPSRVEVIGDVVIINGQAHPRSVAVSRERLSERIKQEGWEQFVEEIAYTWFNRFTALRFMELNGFLPHGLRVLSNPDESKDEPEILEKAHTVELPGLARERVVELKLAMNKEAELYRLLLVAQCNQLHAAMPFLFERINDETELLLPDNLLHSDSVIRKMVSEIDEEDWQQVEIIGWLYQFYISERKDEVIGKVVKSKDIPAATQLFTPNWIVKYMTQNSLGRMWLQTYPDSGLRAKMEYYIEPANRSDEVKKELTKLTPESISPEEIKILDPACGSGHILVEAYDLLKEIYRERGYSSRDIPRLILEKNLYGLDIDERAAQLASFALLMKARADERRILGENAPRLNIMAIPESSHLNASDLASALLTKREPKRAVLIRDDAALFADAQAQRSLAVAVEVETEAQGESEEVTRGEVVKLLGFFEHGKTLGSLIEIPLGMHLTVTSLENVIAAKIISHDLMERTAAELIAPYVSAAKMLSQKYDCVIANPPYMGDKGMNAILKACISTQYPNTKSDVFAAFIIRCLKLGTDTSHFGLVSPFVWMFISTYERFRDLLLREATFTSLVQLEYNAFEPACVPVCTFTFFKRAIPRLTGEFIRLSDFRGFENQPVKTLEAINNPKCGWRFSASTEDFRKISGKPIVYWLTDKELDAFEKGTLLATHFDFKQGLITGNNGRFLRQWFEVSLTEIGLGVSTRETAVQANKKWFPYQKGGSVRKWYGNNDYIVNWQEDGKEIRSYTDDSGRLLSRPQNLGLFFKEGATWSSLTVSTFSMRYVPSGFIFDAKGPMSFVKGESDIRSLISLLNSRLANRFLEALAPTLDYSQGAVGRVPYPHNFPIECLDFCDSAINLSREDWNAFETSWQFQVFPLLRDDIMSETVSESFTKWERRCNTNIKQLQELETENNRLFIKAYGLQDEILPEVTEEEITLARANASGDTRRLISFAIGCMMGRYSLDEPGLVYAQNGNVDFDSSRYSTFTADADGIIPVTDLEWFDDDAANRFSEFVCRAWGDDTYTQNLAWIAAQLGSKSGEMPVETIRRYFSAQFFKDHMQTYKKRPIYWLFSSGKQKAFECLVYLHRYNESTLSRVRNEYVTPLMGKLAARIEHATKERDDATTGSAKNKLQKQIDMLLKKQYELAAFDEQLRHYADQRIHIDLDDGVRANYGKFGTLLAGVKTIAAASE